MVFAVKTPARVLYMRSTTQEAEQWVGGIRRVQGIKLNLPAPAPAPAPPPARTPPTPAPPPALAPAPPPALAASSGGVGVAVLTGDAVEVFSRSAGGWFGGSCLQVRRNASFCTAFTCVSTF